MDNQQKIESARKFTERIDPMITRLESLATEIEQKETEKQTLNARFPDSVISETSSGPLPAALRKLGKLRDEFAAIESDLREEANAINTAILDLMVLAQNPSITYEDNITNIPLDRCKKAKDVIQLLLAEINK